MDGCRSCLYTRWVQILSTVPKHWFNNTFHQPFVSIRKQPQVIVSIIGVLLRTLFRTPVTETIACGYKSKK